LKYDPARFAGRSNWTVCPGRNEVELVGGRRTRYERDATARFLTFGNCSLSENASADII